MSGTRNTGGSNPRQRDSRRLGSEPTVADAIRTAKRNDRSGGDATSTTEPGGSSR